jgi:anti-anti-sigma factor
MIGFERNTVTNISAIESTEVRQLIGDFNLAATGITSLSEKRTEANKALDKAKLSKNAEVILEAQHEIRLIGVKIERFKDETQRLRAELRKILFVAQTNGDNSLSFQPENQAPAGRDSDGRIWRIKVGNEPLSTDKLNMVGGGAVVGAIPEGLPALKLPHIDIAAILQLLPFAAVISLLGFMEAISIAKAMAAKTGQRLDPNQELIGQGLGNCLGAIGQSYPTSGSFSRSAVSLQAGAVTGLSSVITGLAVVIVLMVFTPLLYHLPQSVLAAIIMMAVIGLINISGFVHAWRAQRFDGAISIISFASTLAFAPHLDKGIMIGVFLSLAVFLYKSMRPTIVSLSKADDDALRDSGFHGLRQCEYIAVVRFDGPLFFANASYLENRVSEIRSAKDKLKHILLVCNGISDMDASGEESLSLLVDRTRSAGIDFSLSGVNRSVMAVLKRTHLLAKIGEDHVFPTTNMAIYAIHDQTHSGEDEDACPLITVCRIA